MIERLPVLKIKKLAVNENKNKLLRSNQKNDRKKE